MAQTRKGLHEELGLRIQVETQATKTLVQTTRYGQEAKVAEVMDNFLKGLETNLQEFETQLEEVEAQAECGACQRTGTGTGTAKQPKFDGSTYWAVFRRQFETVVEHNCWTPRERTTYLIAALQGRASEVVHGIVKGTIYD